MKPRNLEFGQTCKHHRMCGKAFTLSSDILDFMSIVQILPLQCHKKSKQTYIQASNKLHNNISLTLLRNGEQKKHRPVIIYCTIRNSSNDSCMLTFNCNLFRPIQASLLVFFATVKVYSHCLLFNPDVRMGRSSNDFSHAIC